MNNETEEFMERLGSGDSDMNYPRTTASGPRGTELHDIKPSGDSSQWAVHPDGKYVPCGPTVATVPAGIYKPLCDQYGNPFFQKINLVTDSLIRLPDSSSDHVLLSIQKFWESEAKFRRFGQIFKRGVLLWGPPGSGKTVSVLLLVEDLIQRGGIVVTAADPELTAKALSKLRQIEPKRNVICILEDIDELTDRYGEANLLSLLDGEEQIDNVVYLATTNYPERLDARLVNRPSRFDEVIKIGMPSAMARRMYIRSRLQVADLADADLQQWVEGTDGLSIAHIRELIAAVFCLGRDYAETLDRLRAMKKAPKSSGGNVIGMHPTKEAA